MPMPIETQGRDPRNAEAMRHLVMHTFVSLLRETNLAPMTVLELASGAIGSVYREVSQSHTAPNHCPCGWEPEPLVDVSMLQAALANKAMPEYGSGLATLPVAGHA